MGMNDQITPGEILLEEYLKPMGISQNAMARAIGVAPRAINEIVHGRRSITPAMSIRFGAFFNQSDQVTTQVPSERAEPLGNERLIIGGQASAVKYHCQSLPSSHSLFLLGRDI